MSIFADQVLPSSKMRQVWWWRDRAIGIAVAWLVFMLLIAISADHSLRMTMQPLTFIIASLHLLALAELSRIPSVRTNSAGTCWRV